MITQFWGHNLSCKPKLQKVLKAKKGNICFVGKAHSSLYFSGQTLKHYSLCSLGSLWWKDLSVSGLGVEWHEVNGEGLDRTPRP